MPEGPELRMNSMFINNVCKGLVFGGRPEKSPVSKSSDISWESLGYSIASESRGKEMALLLQCLQNRKKKIRILFRFGMSGKFAFTPKTMIPKHAHLRFHTVEEDTENGKTEKESGVLSFVDTRRFGSWHVLDSGWGEARGPDIVDDYDDFRSNVLNNLEDPVFGKAMCEVMLNQKYFNGVGNYLRAEVLFRARIPPFTRARDAFQPLVEKSSLESPHSDPDMLELCRDVSLEVISLKKDSGKHEVMTASASESDHEVFLNWLRCYNNPTMSIMKDKNGRTVWFQGEAGPLAPKGAKVKAGKRLRTPDNPNPSAVIVKEEPEECYTPIVGGAAGAEIDEPLKEEPSVPAKRIKVKRERKTTAKAKKLKKPESIRISDAKEKKSKQSPSVSSSIPAALLRRSARLNCETKP